MKRITLLAIGLLLMQWSKAQINAGLDTTICLGQSVPLVAQTFGNFGTSSYTFNNIPYAPEAYAGTAVSLTDDAVSSALPIGFQFCFLGNQYTQFYIGSNGWISFSAGQSTAYTSASIPNTGAAVPKNCIMGPWEDWNPGIGGTIRYQTLGVAPNRRLVVSWDQVPMFQCTTNFGSFQIVIHETTGLIENHLTNKPNCPTWAGGTGTQGVHNDAGTVAFTAPGRNSTQWTTNNESTSFNPAGVVWTNLTTNTIVGYGDSINVTPGQTSDYEAQITLCDGTLYLDTVTVTVANALVFNNVEIPASCAMNDGVGEVHVTGAAAGYLFSWSPGGFTDSIATGLAPGTYDVTVTDTAAGCSALTQIVITSPPPIVATPSQNDVLCNGGTSGDASVLATGGVGGGYTYQWDDPNNSSTFVAQGLPAGTWTVIVSDSAGCADTVSVTITEPPALLGDTVYVNQPLCNGGADGTAEVLGSGGTPPYTYDWNGLGITTADATGLAAGQYTVTVTDGNGCTYDITVDVPDPAALVVDMVPSPATCGASDGGATANPLTGVAPYTYLWDANAGNHIGQTVTGLPVGNYSVVVTDANGCDVTANVTITDTLDIVADFGVSPYTGIPPLDVSANSTSTGPVVGWEWFFGNGATSTGSWTASTVYTEPGTYTVMLVVSNAGGCTDTAYQTVIVTNESSVWVPNVFSPNGDGMNDEFVIHHDALRTFNIVIVDRWGKEVWTSSDPDQTWDGSDASEGTFYFMIQAEGEDDKLYDFKGNITLTR